MVKVVAVVVSVSAGTVGVAVAAGVVISAETNITHSSGQCKKHTLDHRMFVQEVIHVAFLLT